jgi:hypothetical protein
LQTQPKLENSAMNLDQAKVTLDKINSLFRSLQHDGGKVSSIERDLMLSYVKQLYEAFLHESASTPEPLKTEHPPVPKEEPAPVRRGYTPPRIIEVPDSRRVTNTPPKPDPSRQPEPRPRPNPDPQPKPEPQPKPDPRPTPQPQPPRPDPKPEPPATEPTREETATYTAAPSRKVNGLFQFKQATELSEKLSERPIHDLTKALAINDRLLYMNELFGRDLNALNDNLSRLNRLDDMEEAKPLLMQLAEEHDWADEEREDIARDFIRLVRRRYQ